MNTAVFQYYVKMTGYDDGGSLQSGPGEKSQDDVMTRLGNSDAMKGLADKIAQVGGGDSSGEGGGGGQTQGGKRSIATKSIASMRFGEILDSEDFNEFSEKFNEATYNKKLGKLRTDIGDETVNSDSVIATIRKTQATVRDLGGFLAKLYNAPESNLWYREDPQDELYTTLKPDYRKMLRNKYQAKMKELRSTDSKVRSERRKLSNVETQLQRTLDLEKREELITTKLHLVKSVNALETKREEIAD
jgi:hypothetical protein